MRTWRRSAVLFSALAVFAISCSPSSGSSSPSGSSASPATAQKPKRIVVAMMGQPSAFVSRMNSTSNTVPGVSNLEQLVNSSLTEQTRDRSLQPLLAEAVPTIENGLWKLLPDGRMETTWHIRQGARWHDGTPLTADDFVFATAVDRNKEIPIIQPAGYTYIDRVDAVDPKTV